MPVTATKLRGFIFKNFEQAFAKTDFISFTLMILEIFLLDLFEIIAHAPFLKAILEYCFSVKFTSFQRKK